MSHKGSKEIIAGIDLSLRRTGFTIIDSNAKILHQEVFKTDKMRGMQRLLFIKTRVIQKLKELKVTKVVLEGYSFGSKGAAIISLGELGGVVRMGIFENNYDYLDCSPSSLKAYTTGKGNADKDQMRVSVRSKYGIDYTDDNICDSYALCMMVLELGEEAKKFTEKGGVAMLKNRKEIEVRKSEGNPEFFVELLKLGVAKVKDFQAAVMAHESKHKNMPIPKYLGISEEQYEMLTKSASKSLKQLNKEYSY